MGVGMGMGDLPCAELGSVLIHCGWRLFSLHFFPWLQFGLSGTRGNLSFFFFFFFSSSSPSLSGVLKTSAYVL